VVTGRSLWALYAARQGFLLHPAVPWTALTLGALTVVGIAAPRLPAPGAHHHVGVTDSLAQPRMTSHRHGATDCSAPVCSGAQTALPARRRRC
jgi:hypothetical protein